jgi:hypothetical protein
VGNNLSLAQQLVDVGFGLCGFQPKEIRQFGGLATASLFEKGYNYRQFIVGNEVFVVSNGCFIVGFGSVIVGIEDFIVGINLFIVGIGSFIVGSGLTFID